MATDPERLDDWTTRVTRDVEPPPEVRTRVLESLRAEGLLMPRRRAPRGAWLRVAAALVLFAAGWASASAYHARIDTAAPEGRRFMFLLYGETSLPEDVGARAAEYGAWARDQRVRGGRVSGERLEDGAAIVGGSAPAGSSLGGFFIVEAASAEAARALAADHPHVRYGGTIVVRPIAGN